jgi:two-component system, NtrC family, sensor histidine kinase HydH
MAFRLGIPDGLAGATLPRRLLWLNLLRLLVLTTLLALTGFPYTVAHFGLGTESSRLALSALAISFAVAGVLAALLRKGRLLEGIAHAQLVFDQLTWTVFVYLTGGVGSAATLFYGLTCLAGAIATGVLGAWIAASAAGLSYAALAFFSAIHWLKGPIDQNPAFFTSSTDDILYHFWINVLGIVVVTLLGGYLAERLCITGGRLVEAEERAQRAERLAVLGGLASGLAHEIRNPLGSIGGSIRLLSTNRHLSDEDRQLCDIVQRETARLNDLVTDMVDLARARSPEFTEVDVVALVEEVVALTSASGRAVSDVAVRYLGPGSRVVVWADAAQLRQLVWNLVRNAVQASSAGAEVRVSIEESPQHDVLLAVEDEGAGIDPTVIPRLFDPFFTTRSHGSGIGLAVVRRVADEHGFEISVTSRKDHGARFVVSLGARRDSR